MANKLKGIVDLLQYSSDYVFPSGDGAATYVPIPVSQVLQDQVDMPGEEPQTQVNLNGQNLQSGVQNQFVFPVIIDDDDTWQDALKTASSNHTPIWFKVRQFGQQARVIGGRLGCQVTVGEMNAAQFGDFVTRLIGGMTTGADVDDTFELVAGS